MSNSENQIRKEVLTSIQKQNSTEEKQFTEEVNLFVAKMMFTKYQSCIDAGFLPRQALYLCHQNWSK